MNENWNLDLVFKNWTKFFSKFIQYYNICVQKHMPHLRDFEFYDLKMHIVCKNCYNMCSFAQATLIHIMYKINFPLNQYACCICRWASYCLDLFKHNLLFLFTYGSYYKNCYIIWDMVLCEIAKGSWPYLHIQTTCAST